MSDQETGQYVELYNNILSDLDKAIGEIVKKYKKEKKDVLDATLTDVLSDYVFEANPEFMKLKDENNE